MDSVRLIRLFLWFVVGLFLGGSMVAARADDYPIVIGAPFTPSGWGANYPSWDAAVDAWLVQWRAANPGYSCTSSSLTYTANGNSRVYSLYGCVNGSGSHASGTATFYGTYTCPGGGTANTTFMLCQGAASCPSGQTRDSSGMCISPCPAAGTDYYGTTSNASSACVNTCQVTRLARSQAGRSSTCYGLLGAMSCEMAYTGAHCGASDPASTADAGNCPVGQGAVMLNGVMTCVRQAASSTETTKTATQTNPDGATATTNQTTITTCTNGSCTTSTTVTNSGGGTTVINGAGTPGGSGSGTGTGTGTNGTTTGTGTQDKSGFCKENPTSPICIEGSFVGACQTGFACQGDAVECATAKAAWELRCQYSPSDGSTLAERIVVGNDPQADSMPWASGNVHETSVSGFLDTSEHFGAACIPDLTGVVFGHSFTFSMLTVCTWLGWIGNMMFAGCCAGALAIAFGRPQ